MTLFRESQANHRRCCFIDGRRVSNHHFNIEFRKAAEGGKVDLTPTRSERGGLILIWETKENPNGAENP
jgi:hypothetical protein